jgi:NAD(P)-dependent dehydrogenase (short-subunit alcohol dehydrogenase family)
MPPKDTAKGLSKAKAEPQQHKGAKIHEFPHREAIQGARKEPEPPYMEKKLEKPGLESEMEPRPRYHAPEYRVAGKLEGKAALITGGDSGIGRAVAVLYAREGADVAIIHLPEEQSDAEETKQAVEEHGRRCVLMAGDVGDPDFCRNAVESVVERFGKLDILVNNAGFQNSQTKIEDISEAQWDHTFRTNIYGYFHMAKSAVPYLKEGSAIINTGSITGLQGNKDLLDYSSTKGAIHAFTKTLAQQLVERKIRVNCVAPGPIWTPLVASDFDPKENAEHGKNTPMGRAGQPEEVAPAYVFFASEADSSYITGEILTLLGGKTTAA